MLRPFFSSHAHSKQYTNGTEQSDRKLGKNEEVVYDSEGSERGDDMLSIHLVGTDGASTSIRGSPRENVKTNKYHTSVMAKEKLDIQRITSYQEKLRKEEAKGNRRRTKGTFPVEIKHSAEMWRVDNEWKMKANPAAHENERNRERMIKELMEKSRMRRKVLEKK